MEGQITSEMKTVMFVSMATDGWLTNSAEAIISVTTHFIDDAFQLKSRTIGIESLEDQSAKGVNLF